MREVRFYDTPTVARRVACDELATQISVLETELSKGKVNSAELVKQLTSTKGQLKTLRRARTECVEDPERLTSRLAYMSTETEDPRLAIAARKSAACESEMARAGVEAQLEESRQAQSNQNARLEKLNATIKGHTLENESLRLEMAIRDASPSTARAPWQAEQKRNAANETKGGALRSVAMTGQPRDGVWLKVQKLRKILGQSLKEVGE